MVYVPLFGHRKQMYINGQMLNAYYSSVIGLQPPDESFLYNTGESARLFHKLKRKNVVEPSPIKAILYSKIISSDPEKSVPDNTEASSPYAAELLTSFRQAVRKRIHSRPRISFSFLKPIPYVAAAVAAAICLILPAVKSRPALPSFAVEQISLPKSTQPLVVEPAEYHPVSLSTMQHIKTDDDFRFSIVPLSYISAPVVNTQSVANDDYSVEDPFCSNIFQTDEALPEIVYPEKDISFTQGFEEAEEETIVFKIASIASQQETAVLAALELVQNEAEEAFTYYDIDLSHELQDYTRAVCAENDFPFEYALALMYNESKFKADAKSSTGDYGIMQINSCNHKWLKEKFGITDFLDPEQNILCGVYIISQAYQKYGKNINKALMAYNMGDSTASTFWQEGIYTSPYSRNIVSYYDTLIQTGTLP